MQTSDSRQDGFTLIQLVIALALFSLLMLVSGTFFVNLTRGFADTTKKTYLETRGHLVANRLHEELVTGRFISLDPPVPTGSQRIRFDKITGVVSGVPVFGNPVQIEQVPDPEGNLNLIRLWEDFPPYSSNPGSEDSPVTLASNVESLNLTRKGSILQITIRFQDTLDDGTAHSYTITSGVKMRN